MAAKALRDSPKPFPLALGARDARLDPLGEPMSFLFGDRRRNIGDELPGSIGADLLDLSIRDRDGRANVLTVLEEALVDTAESRERYSHLNNPRIGQSNQLQIAYHSCSL